MWTPSCYRKNTKGLRGGFSLLSPRWLRITCRHPHNISGLLRNVADPTANGAHQKPDQLLFPISCTHAFLETFLCVFSSCLTWRICYFSLRCKISTMTCEHSARLCSGTAAKESSVILLLSACPRTRDTKGLQEGWPGRSYGPTQRPAMP